jgi:hypothetical protein
MSAIEEEVLPGGHMFADPAIDAISEFFEWQLAFGRTG